jgi:hypothetical protein
VELLERKIITMVENKLTEGRREEGIICVN